MSVHKTADKEARKSESGFRSIDEIKSTFFPNYYQNESRSEEQSIIEHHTQRVREDVKRHLGQLS